MSSTSFQAMGSTTSSARSTSADSGASAVPETREPKDNRFNQQTLWGWEPLVTSMHACAIFLLVGILFVPMGKQMLADSMGVVELIEQYGGDGTPDRNSGCEITTRGAGTTCDITFAITEDMLGGVFLYYQVQDFYQNHRNYVKSQSPLQMDGTSRDDSACSPLLYNITDNGDKYTLFPCGLVANTFFSDKISLDSDSSPEGLEMYEDGIAWPSDLEKYALPSGVCCSGDGVTCDNYDLDLCCTEEGSPEYECLYPDDMLDGGSTQYLHKSYPDTISKWDGPTNEHFIVWMRTAGLKDFRKLYGRLSDDLQAGDNVTFSVINNWEVDSWKGKKSLVLTTTSWLGGKNAAIGRIFIITGSLALFIGTVIGIYGWRFQTKLGDHKKLL